jgi:hypothetical protein
LGEGLGITKVLAYSINGDETIAHLQYTTSLTISASDAGPMLRR